MYTSRVVDPIPLSSVAMNGSCVVRYRQPCKPAATYRLSYFERIDINDLLTLTIDRSGEETIDHSLSVRVAGNDKYD